MKFKKVHPSSKRLEHLREQQARDFALKNLIKYLKERESINAPCHPIYIRMQLETCV